MGVLNACLLFVDSAQYPVEEVFSADWSNVSTLRLSSRMKLGM